MTADANPLLQAWITPHGLPPFDRTRPEHFAPAFEVALREHLAELDAIAQQDAAPSFENTLAAFDASGRGLRRIELMFHNLTASESTPALQAAERELVPRLAAHESAVFMHAGLFARIEALHEQRATLGLDAEALRLVERVHFDFVLAGARLAPAAQRRYAQVVERLATLYTQFGQNLLADEAQWLLPLEDASDLAGLPEFARSAARQAAAQRGRGGHTVVLSRSVAMPFLTFSTRRDLREQVWRAWVARGEGVLGEAAHDNRPIAAEIMALRLEQAQLHGYASYADYALQDRMAGTPSAVRALLERVWAPAKARAAQDRAALEAVAREQGGPAALQPWDWRHYAEQVRQARYQLDDAQIKPYFQLERMIEAMFDCAGRLFGLRFAERRDVALYHPDVRLWEVTQAASGALVGLFLGDNYARPSKRGGAWMSVYRSQSRIGGGVAPIVVNNNNFAKAPDGEATLLSFDDVRTLFHEFGHGLHGLLSGATYERLAGTQVLRDFVELPSQLFEHWALEPEVLKRHARHVHTDAPIPDALIAKLKAARRFNQAYESVQYTGSALIDLALHAQTALDGLDIAAFERAQRAALGVPEEIGLMHRLPHFRHLFASDGYAAGYYVYMWAEVLDADAFQAFVEAGNAFDAATAERLLRHIYAAGNTVEPRAAYRAFRGRDAAVEAMLAKRGLLPEPA